MYPDRIDHALVECILRSRSPFRVKGVWEGVMNDETLRTSAVLYQNGRSGCPSVRRIATLAVATSKTGMVGNTICYLCLGACFCIHGRSIQRLAFQKQSTLAHGIKSIAPQEISVILKPMQVFQFWECCTIVTNPSKRPWQLVRRKWIESKVPVLKTRGYRLSSDLRWMSQLFSQALRARFRFLCVLLPCCSS